MPKAKLKHKIHSMKYPGSVVYFALVGNELTLNDLMRILNEWDRQNTKTEFLLSYLIAASLSTPFSDFRMFSCKQKLLVKNTHKYGKLKFLYTRN